MSAAVESSPKRTANTARIVPSTVPPQAVSDRTLLDSVTGFINDVTLTNLPQIDPKDQILWVRFENTADISDPTFGEDWDLEGGIPPPLILLLGYGTGVQCWAIPANGEAIEVLSWRHGCVRALRILPLPVSSGGSILTNDDGDYAQDSGGRSGGGGGNNITRDEEDNQHDQYGPFRPLMAICDAGATGSGPQYCSVNFISLRSGEQVKSIKFKNPVLDILANRSAIVVTFAERIAVFDAKTLEDRLTITTCYPGTSLNPNPVTLGPRWLAYAERKMLPSKRSSGGCDCDGVASYTATVLNAAKSLGKGLRELGEQMAAGFSGGSAAGAFGISVGGGSGSGGHGGSSGNAPDDTQPGVVTILDIKYSIKDASPTTGAPISSSGSDPIVAHFIAHSDAIVALDFDCSGLLLATADKRGHDFHVFRVQPHPGGPSMAAVHHLYVLHRGDTTSKVQNITYSLDSRWIAVSTLRGTTHVFPVTPYGGPAGVRTHGSPHVVNRLSRFHRSAGLSVDGRSNSPVHLGGGGGGGIISGIGNGGSADYHASGYHQASIGYNNPRIPPFPHPTVVLPLAQLRQPSTLASNTSSSSSGGGGSGGSGGGGSCGVGGSGGSGHRNLYQNPHINQRQRLTSLSDDTTKPLRVCATFAKARSWLLEPPGSARDINVMRIQRKAVDSLFIMAGHGALIQYDLEPKTNINIPKDKICDDTSIELDVEPKAQWNLLRKDSGSATSVEIQPPLPNESWLLKDRLIEMNNYDDSMATALSGPGSTGSIDDRDDRWLSQVEIITHAGPHRRLWMGPQFMFKTYNTLSGQPLSHIDSEAVEVGVNAISGNRPARSNPMNMPMVGGGNARSAVPVLIESGSCSSYEQSPRLIDQYRYEHMGSDYSIGACDSQLREDLADAMRESPGRQSRDSGSHQLNVSASSPSSLSSAASNASATSSSLNMTGNVAAAPRTVIVSIAKVVNPLGTVTNVTPEHQHQYHLNHHQHHHHHHQQRTGVGKSLFAIPGTCGGGGSGPTSNISCDDLDEFSYIGDGDEFIHANCDESTFRPVVSVYSTQVDVAAAVAAAAAENCGIVEDQPEEISETLVVPVIEKKIADKRDSERKEVQQKQMLLNDQQQHNREKQERLIQWQLKTQKLQQQQVDNQQAQHHQQQQQELKKQEDLQQKKEHKNQPQIQQVTQKIKKSPNLLSTTFLKKTVTKSRRKSDPINQLTNEPNESIVKTTAPIQVLVEEKKLSKKNSMNESNSSIVLNATVSLDDDQQYATEKIIIKSKSPSPTLESVDPQTQTIVVGESYEEVPFNNSKSSKKKYKLQLEDTPPTAEQTTSTTTRRRKPNVQAVSQEETQSQRTIEKKVISQLDTEKEPVNETETFDELDTTHKYEIEIPKHVERSKYEPEMVQMRDSTVKLKKTKGKGIRVYKTNQLIEMTNNSLEKEKAIEESMLESDIDECSSIQDSIFIDPVATKTFLLKKKIKSKPKSNRRIYADLLNLTKTEKDSTESMGKSSNENEIVPVETTEVPPSLGLSTKVSHTVGTNLDFPEPDMAEFDDAFAPLEPFNLQFEIGEKNDKCNKNIFHSYEPPKVHSGSLISFQSPIKENATAIDKTNEFEDGLLELIDEQFGYNRADKNKMGKFDVEEKEQQIAKDSNIIVGEVDKNDDDADDDADDDDADDDDDDDEPPVLLYECQDSDYKSLEQEIDETYLSIELTASGGGCDGVGVGISSVVCETGSDLYTNDNDETSISIKSTTDLMNSSSTDDSEEISQKHNIRTTNRTSDGDDESQGKTQQHPIIQCTTKKYKQEDDEELQPLICALTVSQEESANTSSSDNNTNLLGGDDLIGGMGGSGSSGGGDESIGAVGTAKSVRGRVRDWGSFRPDTYRSKKNVKKNRR